MEVEITNLFVVGRVKLDSRKTKQLLGRQPKLVMFPFPFLVFL